MAGGLAADSTQLSADSSQYSAVSHQYSADSIQHSDVSIQPSDSIAKPKKDRMGLMLDSLAHMVQNRPSGDSIQYSADSLAADSVPAKKESALSAPVYYQSADSMVMTKNGYAYLHGKGEMKYENMELTSEFIRMNLDSSLIFAQGVYDTVNYEWIGRPVFKDQNDSYETNEMTYNIRSKKGYIRHVVTKQGEGYVIADKTKKTDSDVMMMAGGQYTTCDNHEHPHFYLKMTKAKVKPGDYIATGPAYMVVGDVPLPLAIPFGFFPITST